MAKGLIGKVIDNYRILESLGIGGMGVVFKAVNTKLDKLVALKMIAPGLAMNEDFIKRFQKEAKALAKLADPNIVAIYDLRQENEQWYIVMEYIDGPSLSDRIQKKKGMNIGESIPIIKQILSAIGHAHQGNIIHRDIKPNNVMINSDGMVKITDFGLAKDQSISRNTVTVQSGGTLFYMSPEHVKGFNFTDKRSDIYSIGMTFYEMLTGHVPFQNMDTDFDIRESIVRKDFIKPTVYNPKIPKQLESIIMKAISKNPDDRYQSAEEMFRDIRQYEKSVKGNIIKKQSGKPANKNIQKSTRFITNKKFILPAIAAVIVIFALVLAFYPKKEIPVTKHNIVEKKTPPVNTPPSQSAKHVKERTTQNVKETKTPVVIKKPVTSKKPAAKTLTGTIFVNSDPEGMQIYINGAYKGNTPNTIFGVRAGTNELLLKADGYEDYSESITVGKGKKYTVDRKMIPITGSALITYKPENSIIKIDDKLINEKSNPLNIADLSVGSHNLEVVKAGYSTFSKSIEIKNRQTTKIDVTLKQLIGRLTVLVKPWGSIYINNEIQKANTDIKFEKELPENAYTLKIVHPSFGEWKKEISIKHNTVENIVVDFTKMVTVQVNAMDVDNKPITAKIIIDNKPTNLMTPENIKIRPGIHTFLVEKEGFIATEDRKEFLVDNKFNKPITFVLKKVE